MKMGYIGGFWSTNIGNSFYNLGALWLLREVFGKENVSFVPDPPQVYWSTLREDYDLIPKLDLDMVIVSGPILGVALEKIYGKRFDEIAANGGQIGFLSAGAIAYTEKEADSVSQFLNKYPISFVFTRDSVTYELYKDRLNTHVYDGLCTSMFLNDAITPPDVNDKYVVFNFSYFLHDPEITKTNEDWVVRKSIFKKAQEKFMSYPVVRIKSSPYIPNIKYFRSTKFVFPRKNMYFSDLPYGYLSILKSSKYIFSDRVHTCAAGLIFGSKCMYVKGGKRSNDGRNNLFARLNLPDIYERPVSLDFDYIESEKEKMKRELLLVLNEL
jgi:hypothetical protein